MNRRHLLKTLGATSACPALTLSNDTNARLPSTNPDNIGFRGQRTLMFLDNYPLMNLWHAKIHQSQAEYVPEGDFVDPHIEDDGAQGYPMSSPRYDESTGLYHRYAGYADKYLYQSEDAIHWQTSPRPDHVFPGKKAPHHVDRAETSGFGSPVYHDPIAEDGYPYKQLVLETLRPSFEYYLENDDSFFHKLATKAEAKGGLEHFHARKHSMLVSKDGLKWELRRDYDWGTPPLTTEEHYSLFYDHHQGLHVAVYRVRFGDRRLYVTTTKDFKTWSLPRKIIHPDVYDVGSIQYHGSSFHRYDSYIIGFMFRANYTRAKHPMGSAYGPDQTHLAYSYDGQHFNQLYREPIIPRTQPGQPEFRTFWTRGMLAKDDHIYLYSRAFSRDRTLPTDLKTPEESRQAQKQVKMHAPHVIHRLRKDGFAYIEPEGWEAEIMTKLLFLFDGKVTINANATRGMLHYEIATRPGREAEKGYAYTDCVPLAYADSTEFQLRFRNHPDLSAFIGKEVYIRFRFHMTRFYAIRGDFSTDPEMKHRAKAGMPLFNTSWLF